MADTPYKKKANVTDTSPWISLKQIQDTLGITDRSSSYMGSDIPDDGKRYERVDKDKAREMSKYYKGN